MPGISVFVKVVVAAVVSEVLARETGSASGGVGAGAGHFGGCGNDVTQDHLYGKETDSTRTYKATAQQWPRPHGTRLPNDDRPQRQKAATSSSPQLEPCRRSSASSDILHTRILCAQYSVGTSECVST